MSKNSLDDARHAALEHIRRSERRAKLFVRAAGTIELLLFVGIMFVIDFSNSTHLLIFLCACLAYGPLAFGMASLRSQFDASTQRLLRGIELTTDE